jgi:hypothetical protein
MTYSTGGIIAATDYNTLATLTSGMNAIYADQHAGATTLPNAGYGYGQLPSLTPVTVNDNITSSQWSALFDTMRKSGAHQGTTVVPPLPSVNPSNGATITAYTGVSTLLTTLNSNKFNMAIGQGTLTPVTKIQTSASWTSSLTFLCPINFTSWDHIRYFFNSGGYLSIAATYAPVVTSNDIAWAAGMSTMGTIRLLYNSNTGSNPSIGFYGLSAVPSIIYSANIGGGGYSYSSGTLTVRAYLNAAPGTATSIILTVTLEELGLSPAKNGLTSYTISNLCASGSNVAVVAPTVGAATFTST